MEMVVMHNRSQGFIQDFMLEGGDAFWDNIHMCVKQTLVKIMPF